ncbi:MAG: sarcosine oxidase subunit gamma [Chloroflexota bacterium]
MTAEHTPAHARAPLAGVALPSGATARPFLAAVDLRADPADGALCARLAGALGFALPTQPNTAAGDPDGRHALWLGPDEWLVVGPAGTAPAIEAALRGAAEGAFVTATDVSANRTAIELAGPDAREILASGMPIDLHPRAFGPGSCAQTLLSRVGLIVHQVADEPRYRLWVRPSFARYLAAWLADAAVGVTPKR